MSTLTLPGAIQEVVDGMYSGDEARIAGAGVTKRLMYEIITGTRLKTFSRLTSRGKIIASVPLEVVFPMAEITSPVDSAVTVPSPYVYGSDGEVVIDSVAAGDGSVQVDGAWRIFAVTAPAIETPVDAATVINYGEQATSSGALVIDSAAAGDGSVLVRGKWALS